MPEEPLAAGRVGKRSVVRMVAKEVGVVVAIQSTSRGSGKGLRQVDLNKAPTRPKSASRPVGDKEETVGRKGDGGMKSSAGSWGKRQRRVIGYNNRNSSSSSSSSSRDQSDR
jgi:hypothetical protein